MSVTCVLHAASPAELDELFDDPSRIHPFLQRLQRRPCDLGKSWQALHFALTGTTEDHPLPEGFLVAGEPIGDEDVGYGPATALSADDVTSVASLLSSLTPDTFRTRIDIDAMVGEDVYCAPYDAESVDFLVEDFVSLRTFFAERAERGEGVVVQYV